MYLQFAIGLPLNAEMVVFGLFVPWWIVIGVMAYLVAWGVVMVMERLKLTAHVWHLPLFFVAIFVLMYSLIGLLLAP